ncbi:MAG: hypothetical protein M3Q81_02195 [bacterium]|nr:hypothetical protein [bacterium]
MLLLPTFVLIAQAPAGCDAGAEGINLGDCLKLADGQSVSAVYNNPAVLVNLLVTNIFIIAGVVLFFMIMLAGFKFISGSTKGMEEAKQILTTAGIGFVLMFVAFWIVQIIEIVIGQQILF